MTIWDDRILEYVEEEGPSSVKTLSESGYLRVSKSHVSRRCRKLAKHGFLRDLGNGVFQITDRGERYLEGELDAAEDEQDDPVEPDAKNGSNGAAESNGAR